MVKLNRILYFRWISKKLRIRGMYLKLDFGMLMYVTIFFEMPQQSG